MQSNSVNHFAHLPEPSRGIVVFGESAIDILIQVPSFAATGGLVRGNNFSITAGGHGANQAIAARRLGVDTSLVGRVALDAFGRELLTRLQLEKVNTEGILVQGKSSPLAVLLQDQTGEYQVLAFVEGVNVEVTVEDANRFLATLSGAKVALFQLGYPISTVVAAARSAKQAGLLTILDPTPAPSRIRTDLYSEIDIITPNEMEIDELVGIRVDDRESALRATAALHELGVATVVIKMGRNGAFCSSKDEAFFVNGYAVTTVDTVGAGDAFNGALGAALAYGLSLKQAVQWGVAAGAISVTYRGAQSGLPDINTLESFLNHSERATRVEI